MRLLLILAALTAWAQPSAPGTPQMLAKTPSGDLRLSPIVGLKWDDSFENWYFPMIAEQIKAGQGIVLTGMPNGAIVISATTQPAQPSEQIKSGVGIVLTRQAGQPTEIAVDPAQFVLLVPPPSGPGECTVSVPESNIVVMAQGPGFMFSCDPDPNRPGKRRWMATPKFATW